MHQAFLVFALAATTGIVHAASGFGSVCTNIVFSDGSDDLAADCTSGGVTRHSDVNLNGCLIVNNNMMKCQHNGSPQFSNQCTGCSLSGTTLSCSCTGHPSSINLNNCVGLNSAGLLTCA
ncbi:CVNH domain-containing protein [Mycena indigotica]|uniref:CVNH domain-containing protein n=1 Tax=Mycena indigotica TaxID=2126181 RepID=A0A8H6W3S3_9AGAR|nr:CVNH domain-containing protein [Mycena indigotica]KAF7303872.1 CVNH domain-containing protein [Mycena indigotica]